jgi:polysaccharide export outer membrane protein
MRVVTVYGKKAAGVFSLIAAALCLASGAAAQARTPAPAGTAPTFASPYDRDSLAEEYRVAPGDVLQIFVWREPDLSREVRVRTDGLVTVPLLGDVSAVNKTPQALSAELAQQLARFVTTPNVTITVTYSSSQRFFVVGQVTKPGEFPLLGRTTLLQALALAGGFQEFAKTEEVKIIRQELTMVEGRFRAREIVLPANFKALAQGQNLHQNFVLKPGDVIVVP